MANFSKKKVTALGIGVIQNWKLPKDMDRIIVKEYQIKPPEFPITSGAAFKSRIGLKIPDSVFPNVNTAKLFSVSCSIAVKCFVGDKAELVINIPTVISHLKPAIAPQPKIGNTYYRSANFVDR
jgi:hypothetical protein